jgi:hypothetical protein
MSTGDASLRQAQLDKDERDDLEDVVTDLRELVEAEIEYELEHKYDLTEREGGDSLSSEEQATRERLVEAIEHENPGEKSWAWCYGQYITGVGYTIVNRLAAFRCMEVRGFLDRPVTQIGDSGLTPAAERVLGERFDVDRDEALIAAYHEECESLGDEIEILFNPDSRYSVIDPDPDLFRELVGNLDEISDEVWRADDVLGWVYEYYNRPIVERLEDKNTLEAEEVAPANQFYTPHWVVRLLTDNSLGRLYLESIDELDEFVDAQAELSTEDRKSRSVAYADSPQLSDFCTYLLPEQDSGEPTEFEHPSELRVFDPACGSGHFLLYAFDILERIWRRDCPAEDPGEIPRKILANNLYGVDLDLRACQLATFNLYLKGRQRAEEEGNDDFELPQMGIVTADSSVVETEDIADILGEVSGDHDELEEALQTILDSFENVEALGTLLDVKGTLEGVFDSGKQQTLLESINGTGDLNSVLTNLRTAVDEQFDDSSFGAQELQSFLRLLVILTQDYDVALMNPPYGAQSRMPEPVREYVDAQWDYPPEYYINFFEVCNQLSTGNGRIGMLVKREFMFKNGLSDFRKDFIGTKGSFDFLAEFGEGVLDKAKVRNAGTVVCTSTSDDGEEAEGTFIRLHDVEKGEKEATLLKSVYQDPIDDGVQRVYIKKLSEFGQIPGSHMSYWMPDGLREIFNADIVFDADNSGADKPGQGVVKQGLITGYNDRFTSYLWETDSQDWHPFAKGGEDAWILPRVNLQVLWRDNGREIKATGSGRPQNTQHYFSEALTYTYMKSGGRRFGYLHPSSIFGRAGNVFIPESSAWPILSYGNSNLVTYLMAGLDPGRHWEVGNVAKLPWHPELGQNEQLESKAREIVGLLLYKRMSDFDSPHYTAPRILRHLTDEKTLAPYESHPHRELSKETEIPEFTTECDPSTPLPRIALEATQINQKIETKLDQYALDIDTTVFDFFDLSEELRREVLSEVSLRTNKDPQLNPEFEVEEVSEAKEYSTLIRDLVLHFALKAVLESDDGIVPTEAQQESYSSITDLVIEQFERVFGDHAEERLSEVDEKLGDLRYSDVPYPNLEHWLQEDLFEYHLDRFENAPILWRLTSRRLVPEDEMEGFGCFIDYHRFDRSSFDRVQANYIEERKDALNELRAAADRRRNNDSLKDSEQSEAADEFHRYEGARRQVEAFEEQLLDLTQSSERDWNTETQDRVADLQRDIEALRENLAERMDAFEELVDISDEEWLADTFTDKFADYVLDEKEDWFKALDCGIEACDGYSSGADAPVPPHYYDYIGYCQDNIGTTSYHRNGLLFLHHYFGDKEFRSLVEDGEPREGVDKQPTLLARLAARIDQDAELGERMKEQCDELLKEVSVTWDGGSSSDWEGRALDEIMTGGYEPVKKHGVAVNIRPLAEEQIVPEIVDEDVLL